MNDLISRDEAIDDLHGKDPSRIWDTADIEVWVNGLPSVQPDHIVGVSKKDDENGDDLIRREDALMSLTGEWTESRDEILSKAIRRIKRLPSAQPEIIRCKDCKHWRQQTNYQGAPLSFGFCESDNMWRSLYGETTEVSHIVTDDDFYCGYAERRIDDER